MLMLLELYDNHFCTWSFQHRQQKRSLLLVENNKNPLNSKMVTIILKNVLRISPQLPPL